MSTRSTSRRRRFATLFAKLTLGLIAASVLAVLALRWLPVPISGVMLEKSIAAWGDDGYRLRYRWVPSEHISPHMKMAVIAAEDQRFAEHSGFDFEAMADAFAGYRNGERLRGASTISQQTAKNVFLWTGRNIVRKGLEVYFTAMIELVWPKERILETYLNVAEFGRGVFGVEAAAQIYFGKSAAQLNAREAALLAAVLPNPLRLRVDRPSSYVLARRQWILRQMYRLGGQDYLRQIG